MRGTCRAWGQDGSCDVVCQPTGCVGVKGLCASEVVIKLYPQGTVMICGEWDSSDISMHQVMSVTGFL